MKDKNGVEVYFKDNLSTGAYVCTVEWDEEKARFYLKQKSGTGHGIESMELVKSMEVFSNEFENPELLNPKGKTQ